MALAPQNMNGKPGVATDHVDELMQGAGVTLSRAQVADLTRAGA